MVIEGAEAVAKQARIGLRAVFARPVVHLTPALVNGAAGVVVSLGEEPMTVMGFTVAGGRIVEIDAIADSERVRRIAAEFFVDE